MRRIFTALVVFALVLAGAVVATRLYMDRAAENALGPGEDVAIRDLRDPISGNAFLVCPPNYCQASVAPSPIFAVTPAQLAEAVRRLIAEQPNVFFIDAGPEAPRFTLIQHTPLLRFPDIVTVEYVRLGPDRSSLAIYSRARYGKGDFGTNRRRVLAWLERLQQLAGQ
jgi:uncharacterized protein (DUF1499 family)